jgi:hypothetical protein
MDSLRQKRLILLGTLLLLLLVAGGCQPSEPQVTEVVKTKEVEVTVIVEPTQAPPTPTEEPQPHPEREAIQAAWEESPHNTYDLYHGPNTWCARCHSPQNWDPEATIGRPPNCFSCKFPTDDEVRISDGNDLIPEEEWKAVNCENCHVLENDIVTEVAWLDPLDMEYEEVKTTNEICEKCHATTTGSSFGSAVDHKITVGGSAHLDSSGLPISGEKPPQYCTDCHDPHSTEPKACIDCHEIDEKEHAKGKYAAMKDTVTCMACHDASGAEVGPHPDEDIDFWTTQLTEQGRSGPTTEAIVSHSIVYEVECTRCHFEDNPWELTVLTAEGEIPEPEENGE